MRPETRRWKTSSALGHSGVLNTERTSCTKYGKKDFDIDATDCDDDDDDEDDDDGSDGDDDPNC